MKSNGRKESTLIGYSKTLRHLVKYVDLDGPEKVKLFIANKDVKDSRKRKITNDYDAYVKWRGLTWQKPIYRRDTGAPFIPLKKEIDQLISASRGKTSPFLQFIKESACRPIEAWGIKWTYIDSERNVIYINNPAKHSKPRAFKPSGRLIAMIKRLPRTSDYVFRASNNSDMYNFQRISGVRTPASCISVILTILFVFCLIASALFNILNRYPTLAYTCCPT